jgi:histidyl-tRNA synthetase
MHKLAQPVKLSYLGPFFRHERPQAGRYRQFHQVGIECIGTDSPLADAEAIMLLSDLLGELGVPGVRLRLGSLGSLDARRAYLERLKAHLHAHEGELSDDVRERIDINPLRAFDSDHAGTRGVMASAPTIVGALEGEDADHFAAVRGLLDAAGIAYEVDPTLVRGLDYYTRTIFSFVCDALGAQSEIGGGGRYDGLIEQLGGPATPAVGWAAGIERILLALEGEEGDAAPAERLVFIAHTAGESESRQAMALATELRHAGIAAELDLAGRSAKGQLKHALRIEASHVLLLEDGGAVQLRDMKAKTQRPIELANLVDEITGGES